jgi:hypothetical protein
MNDTFQTLLCFHDEIDNLPEKLRKPVSMPCEIEWKEGKDLCQGKD